MEISLNDKNSEEINHETLRHHLYLDCMNISDLIALDEIQIKMIVDSIFQTRKIRFHNSKIFIMINEINLDYQRVMCHFAWQKLLDISPDFYQRISTFKEKHKAILITKTIHEMDKIKTGLRNFQTMKQKVHRNILYVVPEVYDAMSRVMESCRTIMNMSLFETNYGKSLKLSEFEEQQLQASATVIKYLKQQWIGRIVQSVRMCLRDIGKGCFDLNQETPHIYDVIKLKRFMKLKVSMMQSALSTLIKNSTLRYLDMLITPTYAIDNIESDFKWGPNLISSHFPPSGDAIFQIELTMNDTSACYTTDLSQYIQTIIHLLDDAIIQCHQIRPPQVFLLSKLTFAPELYLSTVGLLDEDIVIAKQKLTAVYNRSIIPLKAYANEYNKYLELFVLNVDEYIQLMNVDQFDITQMREEIAFQLAAMEEVLNNLPEFILIGPFKVVVSSLRTVLSNKRKNLATHIIDILTHRIRARMDNFAADYLNIEKKLQKEPRDIEELIELREYMESVPSNVKELNNGVQELELESKVLDLFLWNLSDEDFRIKWHTLAYPLRIETQLEQIKGYLKEALEKFQKLQITDQANLSDQIGSLGVNLMNIALEMDVAKVHEYAIDVRRIWKSLRKCEEQSLHLNERQRLFQEPIISYQHLTKLIQDFEPYKNLWCAASDWLKAQEMWLENPLCNLDGDQIEITLNELQKSISRSAKFFHNKPKIAVIAEDISKRIESFKPYVELVQSLRNPGVKEHHLEKIAEHTKITMLHTSNVTLANLLDCDIMSHIKIIKDITENAAKEYSIEAALNKMINEWANMQMNIIPYKSTGTYIMRISDEILVLLDDHILNTQQLGFSPYCRALEDTIFEWERRLKLTREVLSEWITVQKSWMYLEPIFRSDDISRQLPVEAKKFNTMERNWRRIMKNANECPNIMRSVPDKSLLEILKECTTLMDVVQKSLADYLETKRMIFPRFYFLSDDELLEILAQTKNIQAVQPYLNKCFENMKEVGFENDMEITRMYSAENEEVYLRPSIYPAGNVENWLGLVEQSMRNTLKEIIRDALATIEIIPRNQWVYMWPGQIVICAGQTYWTYHIEDGIKNNGLKSFYEIMLNHLEDLRELVRGQPTDVQRLMLEALITIQVHERDVLVQLMNKKVRNVNDFDWISQLRYYWIDELHLFIHVVNSQFPYGYEYLGNNSRLVITPLTDRCYLTLTGALHLKFGGAPVGPAGTGKTETIKDLAKAFAVQCVVFNCSDQLNFISMGKLFRGLAGSGAWACFDEFNRIDIEVLSVIAQQILTIQKAQQIGAERFMFEGKDVVLKSSCSVFITMNPGYAGRTELPDNLKSLFRPVAMMIPNYALIAEISLFSYGFSNAKLLASKLTTTFKLSLEQLSIQDHYDFGMRAVKTVIAFAGNLKREQRDLDEFQICLRALRSVNVPKFLKSDLILFEGIVMDLFPGLMTIPDDNSILEEFIRQSIREMGLKEVDEYIKKIIQLYETTRVRHGLMLVGPAGSGKTQCYEILKNACSKLHGKFEPSGTPFVPVHTFVLNPKSITLGQLYGEFNVDTHEWTDGILSYLIRCGTSAIDSHKRWYVFDGPVDALWIENMNSLLDDNKKLCLTSGEIIKLLPTQTLIFEVADLKVASPATVSRCGMVYLETQVLGIGSLIDCWINSISKEMTILASEISRLTYQLIPPAIELLRHNLREIVQTVDVTMVMAYINLMNFRFAPKIVAQMDKSLSSEANHKLLLKSIVPWTIFSLVWSFGASCDHDSRSIFSDWIRNIQLKYTFNPLFPSDGLVYDYRLQDGDFIDTDDTESPPEWISWLQNVVPPQITPDMSFSDIEIPTIDSIRNAYFIENLIKNKINILCIGPSGSGKSMTISTKLSKNLPKMYVCDFIIFSGRTSANKTQDWIDSKLEKRRKNVYGPSLQKKQIFFIDDFSMPVVEIYGAQPPLELIRQFMDFKGWYDRKEIGSFRNIEDVNFLAAMGPLSDGLNTVSSRLLRHFHYLAFPEIADEAKTMIFGTIMKSWLLRTPSSIDFFDAILKATFKVFSTVCQELLPTPDRSHYTFNLRDLARIFQGILMAQPEKIETLNDLISLWFHENLRIIGDRLINNIDIEWYDHLLWKVLNEYFEKILPNDIAKDGPILYGDFCENNAQYKRINDHEKMKAVFLRTLEDYNYSTTSPMRLVLFQDAINHICRICRILRQPRGNALLLGMGGSGRQSMTKIAAFLGEHVFFQIQSHNAYSLNDWHEDIKSIMLKAGIKNRSIVFSISDSQIKDEMWLEDLNNILNSGDVPNIYQTDELEVIFQAMRPIIVATGLQMNRTNLFNAYLRKIRNNLHTVLMMSPVGEVFRARIRQFPALVNCSTIDWFHPWSSHALRSVAVQFINDIHDEQIVNDVYDTIIDTCQFMHESTIVASRNFFEVLGRYNYVTPSSYLEMLSNYGKLLLRRKSKLSSEISRFKTGLDKLNSTEIEVKQMQIQLMNMQPELEKATIATTSVINQIQIDSLEAKKMKELAEKQEREADLLKKQNEIIMNEAQADLNQVQPILVAAEASLKSLNKNDIIEVKTMKRPPAGVRLVIEAMCIAKNVEPLKVQGKRPGDKIHDYWTSGIQMLADAGRFLHELENFDKSKITEEIILKLKIYIENPAFHPDEIIHVSKACHSLCLWIHAMYNYYFVNLKVTPKMAALKIAESELLDTETQLQSAVNKLHEVENGIRELEQRLITEENNRQRLEEDKQLCEDRMLRAVRLIDGLSEEKIRWTMSVTEIETAYYQSVGDILISSGAIAYLTPFTDDYRTNLFRSWRELLNNKIPHTPECTPESILGDPVLIRKWEIDGLPRDSMSITSAVLVANSNRWPLFIDPQNQANRWIKKTEDHSGISIVKISEKDSLRVIENCVRFGRVCLIENIDLELDPALNNILTKTLFSHLGQTSIKIGDNVVPYNDQFRLYITTKLSNPHYTPEVAAKLLMVNFTPTSDGFEDQMLSLVVMQERPDLEETRSVLIISCAQMRKDLKDIEDKILERLSISTGSTVDDIDLIVSLEASKIKSNEIKVKVTTAETTRINIDSIRALYHPVANRARVLFFCICDLQYVDYMYQYSLEWFIKIFIDSMNNADKSSEIQIRVDRIINHFTFSLYTNICRSLFEKNKLHFAFLICVRIQMDKNLIDNNEWRHLLSSPIPLQEQINPVAEWLPAQCWREIKSLEILKNFKDFALFFSQHLNEFKTLFDSHEPETYSYPDIDNRKLDDIQMILVLKSLRPDRILNAIQLYITKYLGRQFVELVTTELTLIYKESSPTIPLLFILSSGTDPASDLYKFADKLRMGKKLYTISLGQGQGPRAELMVQQSVELGYWVFFQNCHLAPSWMTKLETIINNFPDTIHRDFRLWLTSIPTVNFPVSILENSSKITIEPPRGIRANMLRSYMNQVTENHEVFKSDHLKHGHVKSLLLSLCMFHSILLERRKFGSLGFNIPYEFTDGDLAICISQLYMFTMEYNELPFEVLTYTAGHINYGGRITDDWDRRCLLTILQDFYQSKVITSDHKFDSTGLYHQLPSSATFKDYIEYIENLPINDDPVIFGLHNNADISYSSAESYACLETLLLLQPKILGEVTLNFEERVLNIINDIKQALPETFSSMEIQRKYPVMYEESLNIVLQQETSHYNELLHIMILTLHNLLNALKGQIVMSEQLDMMAQSLFNNKIPKIWYNQSYPSLKPLGSWLNDLNKRIDFMQNWNENGIPPSFWICGFYFPYTLLTATLQNFARKYTLAIDTIDFSYEVQKAASTHTRPIDGCIIYGLYLEGCRWDGDNLEESYPKKLYSEMNPIYLLPEKNHKCSFTGIYICPVYKTLERAGILSTTGHSTNFIVSIEVPTKYSSVHWIKRGVALICALNH